MLGKSGMKLMIVLGGGGHTTEMLKLVDLLGPEYEYHYLLVREVAFSRDRIKRKGQIHQIRRPRGMYDSIPVSMYNSLVALAQMATILVRVRRLRGSI